MAKRFRQRGIRAFLYDQSGGITQSDVGARLPWDGRDVSLYQEFWRLYLDTAYRIESADGNTCISLLRINRSPNRNGRLAYHQLWPHLPGMELILVPGDYAHAARDLETALRLYEEARRAYPRYIWVYQRLAEVYGEIGRPVASQRAREMVRQLGGG